MLNMVSAILQQEPPLSVNYTIIWGRGRLSAWLLWALSCFNISFCPNTFLQNETTKHWWKQNKTWNKLIWTLDTCVMGFIWFRGLNQILTTLALCVTIEASFTILRDIMGEDQLQRLSKIDSSESLLFQLEMEKKKKSLLCCWVLQYTERVRVPSGNVSRTNFPLQNVPQMFRQIWGTLVPSENVWVSERVSWMFLTLINLPYQAQKGLGWAVLATNGQKSAATFCACGLFHF